MPGVRMTTCRNVILAVALCTVCGCTEVRMEGDTTVYTFALWVPGPRLCGRPRRHGRGAAHARKIPRLGWAGLIGGPVLVIVVVPGMVQDKVTVNNDGFTLHTGFWFAPTVHEVRFEDVNTIELIAEEKRSRRGKQTSYYFLCHKKSGVEKVPLGTLMQEGAAAKIVETARKRGILVLDQS